MNSANKEMICVVSGANRGIGLEFTRQLLAHGTKVYAGVRDLKKAPDLRALESSSNGRLKILTLDVSSDSSVRDFAAGVDADRVDLLINNAGVLLDGDASLESLPSETILKSLDINSVGPVRLTTALMAKLEKAKQARVANITSQMGSIADNSSGGSIAYRMSKTALNMFTKCLAIEKRNLITLCLHPGWVQTDMGGRGAMVTPQKSVEGLLNVILEAGPDRSGHFVRFDGKEVGW